jgi:hypothetical protein
MLLAAMYRGYLIAVLSSGLLLNGGAGIAAARSLSPSAQLCAADAQALTSFAEQGPTLTPALRATVARLIVRMSTGAAIAASRFMCPPEEVATTQCR